MKVNDDIIKQIRKIVEEHPHSYANILQCKKQFSYLNDYILEWTKDFADILYSARVFYALSKTFPYAKCIICGKELKHDCRFDPLNGLKIKHCCTKCAMNDNDIKDKRKATNIKKYGSECTFQSDIVKEKIKAVKDSKTVEEKKLSNEKRVNTIKKMYGEQYSSISQVPDIAKKMSDTQKNFSEEKKDDIRNRIKKTKLDKYGDENYVNKKKISESHLSFSNDKKLQIEEKKKSTNLIKYGVENVSQSKIVKDKISEIRSINSRISFYTTFILKNDLVKPLFDCDYYVNHAYDELKWKCKKCGKEFTMKKYEHQPFLARCLDCFPLNTNIPHKEDEVVEFIKSFYSGKVRQRVHDIIAPKELDIYVPDKKLAIEYDGIYWHSVNVGTPKNYHLQKTEECLSKSVHLVHVFESEWLNKKDIVKSRLKNLFGVYDKTIFARRCEVNEIDSKKSSEFLDENHLQGQCRSKVNLGLYLDGQLISLMTFGRSRFNKKYEWELLRFCNKLGYHIPGGASRLLKYFERNYHPTSMISYADRRWSTGNLYEKLGFKFVRKTSPDYWYIGNTTNGNLMHRSRFQKNKLDKILDNYDKNLTEYENMRNNGYLCIYDSGNYVFEKSKQ